MDKHQKKVNIIIICLILVLVLVALYSGLQILKPTIFDNGTENGQTPTKTIERDGKEYFPRQDITVLLFMGIDKSGKVESSNSYNNDGESDVVMLAVFDDVDKTYDILALNRDSMVDIQMLGVNGKPAGTMNGQLALAHTYGSGLKDSCENVRTAVSDLLYNAEIDYYLSMNMDAISIITDEIGGVEVEVKDDLSAIDPSIPMGKTVLNGSQALNFVRGRYEVADGMNISRMERQREFINGFTSALNARIQDDTSFVIDTYGKVADYTVSDCSVNTLSHLLTKYSDYTFNGVVTPKGENRKGDEFMEFYIDEADLDKIILDLLYAEK